MGSMSDRNIFNNFRFIMALVVTWVCDKINVKKFLRFLDYLKSLKLFYEIQNYKFYSHFRSSCSVWFWMLDVNNGTTNENSTSRNKVSTPVDVYISLDWNIMWNWIWMPSLSSLTPRHCFWQVNNSVCSTVYWDYSHKTNHVMQKY